MNIGNHILFAALLLALPLATAADALARDACYRDWSDAAPVVARERLKTARDVQDLARGQFGGDVVRITLCRDARGFVYHLVVRRADGRISNLVVSAAAAE
jgi:hypothetical protein